MIWGGLDDDGCLSATDGHGGDRVIGGPGTDTADGDAGDDLNSVETVLGSGGLCYAE